MPKFILSGFILIPEADLEAVLNELPTHIGLTRKESSCLIFEVTQDKENHLKFNVHEEFVDENAFIKHQERVRSSTWGAITKNVERHYKLNNTD